MDMKRCSKCGREKELSDFIYIVKTINGSVTYNCKKCSKCRDRKRKEKKNYRNKPIGKEKERERKRNADKTSKGKASKKRYRTSPAGKASKKRYKASPAGKASQEKYYASPAGKALREKYKASPAGKASHNKYNATPAGKASREKYKASPAGKATRARERHTRRANGKLVVNDLTDEQWAKRLKENNYCCYRCGKPFTIDDPATRDHIVPPKLKNGQVGLGLTFENILPAHRSCNASKSNKLDMGRLNTWFVLLK